MGKKILAVAMTLILAAVALCGCNLADKKTAGSNGSTFEVTITNLSAWTFHEMYVSSTASNDWGEDLLSSSVLEKGDSHTITLQKYDFENYDIQIIDEEGDAYEFTYVPLKSGYTVRIDYDDGPLATILDDAGEKTTISGNLVQGEDGQGDDQDNVSDAFFFTIANESDYDIYAIYIAPAYTDGPGIDILPEVLAAGETYEYHGSFMDTEYEGITEWTMHVVDVDNDTSVSKDVFIPWQISYVDIDWDNDTEGYVCTFFD